MQQDFFPETLEIIYNKNNSYDLSKPVIKLDNPTRFFATLIKKRTEYLQSLPEERFFIIKETDEDSMPKVYDAERGRFLAVGYGRNVYPTVNLLQKQTYLHTLVAEFFLYNDNPNYKCHIDHIDCNPHNYRVDNLEWVSESINMKRHIAAKDSIAYYRRLKHET